ncbi:MAG: hypothetical protein LC676_16515 [Loktanella sp.]|nr:hypothetical protein [Loktanella sp.]
MSNKTGETLRPLLKPFNNARRIAYGPASEKVITPDHKRLPLPEGSVEILKLLSALPETATLQAKRHEIDAALLRQATDEEIDDIIAATLALKGDDQVDLKQAQIREIPVMLSGAPVSPYVLAAVTHFLVTTYPDLEPPHDVVRRIPKMVTLLKNGIIRLSMMIDVRRQLNHALGRKRYDAATRCRDHHRAR